jgi:uncharacterized protein (TIGR03435 family)
VRVLPGGRVESYGHTLRILIAWAFDVNMLYQRVEGKQDLLETELVISAKAAATSLTSAQAKAMLRALLEERFQLRWRWGTREIEGYLLVPAREGGRSGPGLRPFAGDCQARADNVSISIDSPDYEQKARCGWAASIVRQRGLGVSMATIADRLSGFMAAPVSDRTGWPGLFTLDISATIAGMPLEARMSVPGSKRSTVDAPSLLEAFRHELGLKLVSARTTTNDLIVERVAPLIEN